MGMTVVSLSDGVHWNWSTSAHLNWSTWWKLNCKAFSFQITNPRHPFIDHFCLTISRAVKCPSDWYMTVRMGMAACYTAHQNWCTSAHLNWSTWWKLNCKAFSFQIRLSDLHNAFCLRGPQDGNISVVNPFRLCIPVSFWISIDLFKYQEIRTSTASSRVQCRINHNTIPDARPVQ